MLLKYNEIRELVRKCLAHSVVKAKGNVLTFNHKRFSNFIGKRKLYPVDMSVVWNVIFNEFKDAIVEVRIRNHRKCVIFNKNLLIRKLQREIHEVNASLI